MNLGVGGVGGDTVQSVAVVDSFLVFKTLISE